MKTLLLAVLVVSVAGGGVWYATTERETPSPQQAQQDKPPVAPPVEWTFSMLQPGGPPPPLPTTVNCTVLVNGSATGTFPLSWDGIGWAGNVTVPGVGTRPVFLNMGFTSFGYTPPLFVATVSPFGQATHSPSSAHYCTAGPISPLNIRADVTASTRPQPHVANTVVFVFQG